MTTITIDDVKQLASLSALSLSDEEAESLRADLQAILGYVEQLDELDTSGVEPTYQVTQLGRVWREDEVEASDVTSETLVPLSAETKEHQFKVPKVL